MHEPSTLLERNKVAVNTMTQFVLKKNLFLIGIGQFGEVIT